jgi:hypothetical protein
MFKGPSSGEVSEEDFDPSELLSPHLQTMVERKMLYFQDPTVSCEAYAVSMPVHRSLYYQDIARLHQHIAQARLEPVKPWLTAKRTPSRASAADSDAFPEFKRELDSQMDEITGLLERFQEKVEQAEAE